MKTRVVVSRKWNAPSIEAFIDQKEIGAHMDLDAFLEAVVTEMGNPTLWVSKAQVLDKVKQAKEVVLAEMRQATKFVA